MLEELEARTAELVREAEVAFEADTRGERVVLAGGVGEVGGAQGEAGGHAVTAVR